MNEDQGPMAPDVGADEQSIGILIVDAQPIVRAGLRTILENAGRCAVVAEAGDGYAAVLAAKTHKPHVVVLDTVLTRMDAYETIQRITNLETAPQVLVCFVAEDAFEVQQLIQAGATGFIAKNAEPNEFKNAVQAIFGGGNYFSNALISNLFNQRRGPVNGANVFGLTQRETEILRFLSDGFSNREVARRLDLSVRTVETHRLNIRKKTKAGTLSDLVRVAKKIGLVGPGKEALQGAETSKRGWEASR